MAGLVPATRVVRRNSEQKPGSLVLQAFATGRSDVGVVFEAALRGWPGQARP
jgi:hypothetical protein